MDREFDQYSKSYEDLLDDPIRNRFGGGNSRFFHVRKRDIIRDYFVRRGIDSRPLRYLDLGCGKGELATLLKDDFFMVAGCDPSRGMLESAIGIQTRVQDDPGRIPFDAGSFDLVTAVCVYHHVPPDTRAGLTREAKRVLRPGGIFCIMEHNPLNPVTRLIVSRTPVDSDAVLLGSSEACRLMRNEGLATAKPRYFLYLPERLFSVASFIEKALVRVPAGGQYAVFGTLPG